MLEVEAIMTHETKEMNVPLGGLSTHGHGS